MCVRVVDFCISFQLTCSYFCISHCFTYVHEGTGNMFTASETFFQEVYCSSFVINCVTLFCNVKTLVSGVITTNNNTIP
jgi:hypothetical protein